MTDILAVYGNEIIIGVIGVIFTVLGFMAKRILKNFLDTKEKRQLAKDVVLYVEQTYKKLHGAEKYEQAADAFAKILQDRGIKTTTLEIKTLIESALGAFNDAFKAEQEN
jgi:intergrase/recombinase